MKKIVLSAVAVLAMSSLATAGGDIEPVPIVEESVPGNFFVGLSYSCYETKQTDGPRINTSINEDFEAVMFQAGYRYNEYVAFEFRYWLGLDETVLANDILNPDSNTDSWGLYVKPTYPMSELSSELGGLDVYALLGYASTSYDMAYTSIEDADGFSWGLGVEYTFSNNIALFVDYANLNDNSNTYNDDYVDTYNFGVAYKF